MDQIKLIADISRDFLKDNKVYQYSMKKISDLSDKDVIRICHWYCEENDMVDAFNIYRDKIYSLYTFCSFYNGYIEDDTCCKTQMIANGSFNNSDFEGYNINPEEVWEFCSECRYRIE